MVRWSRPRTVLSDFRKEWQESGGSLLVALALLAWLAVIVLWLVFLAGLLWWFISLLIDDPVRTLWCTIIGDFNSGGCGV